MPEHSRTISTPDLIPRHFARSVEIAVPDTLALNLKAVRFRRYRYAPAAMDAVEFEQMSGRFRPAFQLVDMDDLNLRVVECGTQRPGGPFVQTR